MPNTYKMTISRLTVDKLGVKLYDRVSAVIAEMIANSYDADAKEVEIKAPVGVFLATKQAGTVSDKGLIIEVKDNGSGMTPDEVNSFYLIVGSERRNDPRRGGESKLLKRKVMGRKGVGKLAPFGVCERLEILTSGGALTTGKDESGKTSNGYLTAHLILDRTAILSETDEPYFPEVGLLDGTVRAETGTTVRLSKFDHRKVPTMAEFERQLSQRFGLASPFWRIQLIDSLKASSDPEYSRQVGEFTIAKMDDTEVRFEEVRTVAGKATSPPSFRVVDSRGKVITDLESGFNYDGRFYPITGWVGYSKQPYKDDLMAGVRVYCRGKIAAQTHIFNMKAGFTGEYDIRSYLVGELHADWLDETEDLIRTDRQDILWSHDLGQNFETWGQALVKKIGALTREPRRKKAWQLFKDISDIEARVLKAFPSDSQKMIRENTLEMAKTIARTAREDELSEPDHVESLIQLSFMLGPHVTLDRKLREASETKESALSTITGILKTARIAELSSFGQIADHRVQVIKKVETLKDDATTLEAAFQALITEAPWLVNPQWSPITSNQSFTTLKTEFQKYYEERTGNKLVLDAFGDPKKRVDFVLSNQDNVVEMVEIKRPGHTLQNEEMARINTYVDLMTDFLELSGNAELKQLFPKFHVTLVCDKIGLTSVHKGAFENLTRQELLTHINWKVFLLRTRKMHEAFLKEAERQRLNAAK